MDAKALHRLIKILIANNVKEEFNRLNKINRKGSKHFISQRGTRESSNSDFFGLGEYFYLTPGFKDVILEESFTK
jgi:hypothetical protein